MSKTLSVILHYNTPQYTDVLYEMLAPEQEDGNYELIVVDNNSDIGKESKYTTYKLETNVFFGGALNACMEMVAERDDYGYDSLLFLNSDLITGKNLVKTLRKGLEQGYDIVSPSITQPEKTQIHWQQMINWGSNIIRHVKWIDLQCPLISKKFIKQLKIESNEKYYIDPLLLRGWGPDVYFGIIAKKLGFKIGVVDFAPVVHLGSMTMKSIGNVNEYCRLAEQGMYEFINKMNLDTEFIEMRKWAENYKI